MKIQTECLKFIINGCYMKLNEYLFKELNIIRQSVYNTLTKIKDCLASWMSGNKRDDFTIGTKRIIASKVGYRCSIPNCRKFTASPDYKDEDSLNLGIAAHIAAASEGGPRYDRNMTQDQRKHENNDIWLCNDCAHIIDSDREAYSTQTLLNFKRWAEKKAKSESRVKEDGIKKITEELVNVIEVLPNLMKMR